MWLIANEACAWCARLLSGGLRLDHCKNSMNDWRERKDDRRSVMRSPRLHDDEKFNRGWLASHADRMQIWCNARITARIAWFEAEHVRSYVHASLPAIRFVVLLELLWNSYRDKTLNMRAMIGLWINQKFVSLLLFNLSFFLIGFNGVVYRGWWYDQSRLICECFYKIQICLFKFKPFFINRLKFWKFIVQR